MIVKEIIKQAEDLLSKEDLNWLKSQSSKSKLIMFHHNIGRYFRNELNLWHDSTIQELFERELNLKDPDDISQYIIEQIWENK